MIGKSLAFYLLSRGFSAFANLIAVAVYTRLAGPEVYGHYVVMFATALVITGFSAQWIRFAFFKHYQSDEDRDLIASFVTLLVASMLLTTLCTWIVITVSGQNAAFAGGALLIGLSIAFFEVITEVSRARIQPGLTALSLTLKALLSLSFGAAALYISGSAVALAVGISVGHIVATVPAAVSLARLRGGRPNWLEMRKLLVFGWPLILSFGIGAFSQGADRFFLAGIAGAAAVGAYGALSDLVRASLLVLAESISLATVPLAKRQFAAGDTDQAAHTLEQAFKLLLVVGTFFGAGLIVGAPTLLPIVFPQAFLLGAEGLLPIIIISALVLVFRSIYLAQIIFFTRTSHLELVSSLILALVNLSLCAYLVPRYGAIGAAVAFLGGQIAAALFLIMQRGGGFAMPVPWRPSIAMLFVGALLVLAGRGVLGLHLSAFATLAAQALIFVCALTVTALAFGLRPKDLRGAHSVALGTAMLRK